MGVNILWLVLGFATGAALVAWVAFWYYLAMWTRDRYFAGIKDD
jgi:hypothetical protein